MTTATHFFLTDNVNAIDTDLIICDQQTSGALNFGTNTRTGDVNIATGAGSDCEVNINNGASSAGQVNIATGTTGSTTVSIASGTGTTGDVTIGNPSNTTTMRIVSLTTPLTLGTSPTANGQIGFRSANLVSGTFTATLANTAYNAKSFTLPTLVAPYLIEIRVRCRTVASNFVVSLSTSAIATISFASPTQAVSNNQTGGGASCSFFTTVSFIGLAFQITVRSTSANSIFEDFCVFSTRLA